MTDCMESLLAHVIVCDWATSLILVNSLYFHVKVYCISHNIDYVPKTKCVQEMESAIRKGRWTHAKQERFFNAYKKLVDEFYTGGEKFDTGDKKSLKKKLHDLVSLIQHDFGELCTRGTPLHAEVVRDDILELQWLSEDIAKLNNKDVYSTYMIALQEGMRCASRIPSLQFHEETVNGKKNPCRFTKVD